MPVHRGLGLTNRPDWSSVTSAGIFRVPRGGRFDRHFHDCHEYWRIFKGRAKILTEGQEFIVGPGDMAAAMGMPHSTVGQIVREYPGDHWHWILMRILVAARNCNLQAIDGPYAAIRDLDGFRQVATRSRQLGYDGKWALHPDQITILNEVFTPTQEEYDRAEDILEAYQKATEEERRGAVMFGDEMIDEASRKMAAVHAAQGRAAGLKRSKA